MIDTTRPDAGHWHVLAESARDTHDRAFPERLTEQQARDFADALIEVDGADTWTAVWVHRCPAGRGCTYAAMVDAFDAADPAPYWQPTR